MDLAQMLRAQWPITIEASLVLVALLIALSKPSLGSRVLRRIEKSLGYLARKRSLAVVAVILIGWRAESRSFPLCPSRRRRSMTSSAIC